MEEAWEILLKLYRLDVEIAEIALQLQRLKMEKKQ